jgi:SNF2 family DNA or RNA helicase
MQHTRHSNWLTKECRAIVAAAPRRYEDLREYQHRLVQFMLETPKSAAYVDMGLGKTACVLTLLDFLFTTNQANRVLIIAPLRVAVQTWPTELAQWKHTCWLPYTLIRARPGKTFRENMRRLMRRKTPISIINREQVTWLVEEWGGMRKWPYDTIIVDESTSFADHRTRRWKSLAKVAQHTSRLHLLSGTPAPEGIQDLFAQIYLLDGGARFGRSVTHFNESYLTQNVYTKRWTPQPGAVQRVSAKIADICMTLKEEDAGLDMQQPLVIERPIILEPSEMTQYKRFERELILQLKDTEIEAVNAGVLSMKLMQYASGAVYDAERGVHVVHRHKLDELKQIVEENPGESIICCYWFKTSLSRISKEFPDATIMDKQGDCITDWNAGKIPLLLIHPQSAGHGLNLQFGGRMMVWYDTPASLELYLQTVKRIARPGQTRLVKVLHLTARGTIEQEAVPKLMSKQSMQDTLVGHLRRLREKLLSGRREAA